MKKSQGRRIAVMAILMLILSACVPSAAPVPSASPAQQPLAAVQDGYFTLSLDPPVRLPNGQVRLSARAVFSGGSPFYADEPQTREIMHADHGQEDAFEISLRNADRTIYNPDSHATYTDVGAFTRLAPGDALTGYLDVPRPGNPGYSPVPPGDYWARVVFSYTLADEPAEQTWLRPRYMLTLEAPFTLPKE
ncbi:MAG: hypothetical protein ACOYJA_07325 [Christensenellales bacterium]|jgi:hypothetical protein